MKGKERTRTRAEGVAATSAGGMKKKKGKPLATSGLGAMGPKAPFRLEMVRAGDLADNPANWRRHPAGQVSAIRAIIRDPEVGWAAPLLYNERTGRLIDGHARKRIVEPEEFVPVIVGSWTEEGEKKILATLDPLAGMVEVDPAALQALLADLALEREDFAGLRGALDELVAAAGLEAILADGRLPPEMKLLVKPPAHTWVLIGIPTLRFYEVNDLVERLSAVQGATVGISVTDEKRQD